MIHLHHPWWWWWWRLWWWWWWWWWWWRLWWWWWWRKNASPSFISLDALPDVEFVKDSGTNFLKSKLSGISFSQLAWEILVMLVFKLNGWMVELELPEVVLLEVTLLDVVFPGPKSFMNSFSIVEYNFLSDNSKVSFVGYLSLVYI